MLEAESFCGQTGLFRMCEGLWGAERNQHGKNMCRKSSWATGEPEASGSLWSVPAPLPGADHGAQAAYIPAEDSPSSPAPLWTHSELADPW